MQYTTKESSQINQSSILVLLAKISDGTISKEEIEAQNIDEWSKESNLRKEEKLVVEQKRINYFGK